MEMPKLGSTQSPILQAQGGVGESTGVLCMLILHLVTSAQLPSSPDVTLIPAQTHAGSVLGED